MGEAIVFIINGNFAFRATHPLPRTVLTVSKCGFGLLRQRPLDATGLSRGEGSRSLLCSFKREDSTGQARGIPKPKLEVTKQRRKPQAPKNGKLSKITVVSQSCLT
jgi:hypothetical protein